MTKFTLNRTKNPAEYWNGKGGLPADINVMSYHPIISEFELLSLICALHGYLTAFDILTGGESNSEKDTDINAVMTAFQMYIYPKMPISNYSSADKRMSAGSDMTVKPINVKKLI